MQQEQGGCSGIFRCGKATTYEGGIHVPAFIHWTGVIEPRKSNELFSAMDIVPTVMNIVGHPIEKSDIKHLHGVDQSGLIFHHQKVNHIASLIGLPIDLRLANEKML